MLEQVAVLIGLFGLLVDEGDHGTDLIVPDILLQHQILVLTHLLDLSEDVCSEYLVELGLGVVVPVDDVIAFLFREIFWDLKVVLNALAVILEVFSGFVDALEEIHHVSKADIDLHLIHVLEDLCRLYFALNLQANFRSVHAQLLLVEIYPLATIVAILCGLIVLLEKYVTLNLGDVLNEERNDLSELVDAVPEAEQDGFLEEVEDGVEDLQVVDEVARILVVFLQEVLYVY